MCAAPLPLRAHHDPDGTTWRAVALMFLIMLVALIVALAVLVTAPARTVMTSGEQWTGEELPGNYTSPWPEYKIVGSTVAAIITLPAGANVTAVVAQFAPLGGWQMDLFVGGMCDFRIGCIPAGPGPPTGDWYLYSALNATEGSFGWEGGTPSHPFWGPGPLWLHTNGTGNDAWTLSWSVYYTYPTIEPFL